MDFSLNEREKMLQNLARDFAAKSVRPRAAEIDRTNQFPFDLVREMGRLGFPGLPYPEQYGGSGAGYLSYALVLEQICQASMAVGAILSVNGTPAEAVLCFGSEEQKKTFLTPLADGSGLGCICFTEAETGSDPALVTTVCRRSGSSYVITGRKQFVASAAGATLALVFAKRDDGEGLNAFVVDTALPGFVVGELLEPIGARGLGTSVVYLEDIEVPAENLLGEEGNGFEILLEAISLERLWVAIQAVGIAQEALDVAIVYARERKAMGRPIARMQSIRWLTAEMAARVEASRWLAYHTAFVRDQGESIRYESALAKLYASQAAVEVTRMAMQVTGAYGALRDMPVERLYRDAKITEIYVGIAEIQRQIAGSYLL